MCLACGEQTIFSAQAMLYAAFATLWEKCNCPDRVRRWRCCSLGYRSRVASDSPWQLETFLKKGHQQTIHMEYRKLLHDRNSLKNGIASVLNKITQFY